MTNSKRAAFNRLAPKRVDAIREKLRVLGNCSSKNYDYNPEIVRKLFALLFLEFISTAKLFGVNITATVDGQDITFFES